MGKASVHQTDLEDSVIPRRFPHRDGWPEGTKRSVPINRARGLQFIRRFSRIKSETICGNLRNLRIQNHGFGLIGYLLGFATLTPTYISHLDRAA
ncbi:MAG: hypothetical protein LGR52_05390 [Candidatus Thiosymbion ectosymbiont of Robbea hypermnestra]|nr:hypothetical protein [Candidatus Thiosymbion ectosymbiont of Robbea hypermnestra]